MAQPELTEIQETTDPISTLIETARLLVCVGPGGVGKTTTAAALGLRAAIAGRKTIVLTIDPAKRLANSLGLESLTNQPQRIQLVDMLSDQDQPLVEGGELWAMMLDSKQTFDELVYRLAPDRGALENARENNIYRLLSSALHGMQEYMALEKLHDLYTGGYFDLVVLDTPPTKNALEFLETPGRASQFFDERIIRWFLPSRQSKGLIGRVFNAGSLAIGLLGKLLGEAFIQDLVEFFETFQYLQETLKNRGDITEIILRDPDTYFFVITSADPRRIKEAVYFHEKLAGLNQKAEVFILNRVIPNFSADDIAQIDTNRLDELLKAHAPADASSDTQPAAIRDRLLTHYTQLAKLAIRDRDAIKRLADLVGPQALRLVPLLQEDVHNLGNLLTLGRFLSPETTAE